MASSLNKKVFPFREIDSKWINYTYKKKFGEKKYILEMFPYPSGNLHTGHARNYTIVDVLVRFFHLKGYEVIRPLGWDSFGLPAEMAAIERGMHPGGWTRNNIENMKQTLLKLNYVIDWDYELSTCEFSYYKHQQELFKEMYKKGYIIRKEEFVNWDPETKTVLANEQVIDGKAWRSGATVERKKIVQWFFNVSKYAGKLLKGIEDLVNWPERVRKMQTQWIGAYEGYILKFTANLNSKEELIEVYTTKPYTVYGATFIAVGKEVASTYVNNPSYGDTIGECLNSYTGDAIPIIVADYVIDGHGTGFVMGVPCSDERDYGFAKTQGLNYINIWDGEKLIHSGGLNGLTEEEAIKQFTPQTFYKLKDWCISRQRYWGAPIPVIHCKKCGIVLSETPVRLPDKVEFGTTGNPIATNKDWLYTKCPTCNADAIRETDTMDTFVDSSWYFLRYICNQLEHQPLDSTLLEPVTPVHIYVGGIEHAILHLLYARFFMIMLKDLGYVYTEKPFEQVVAQGMVCHRTYKGKTTGKYYYPKEIECKEGRYYSESEEVVEGAYEKMSKSLKNVVDPGDIIDIYGSDSLRIFIISDSPTNKDFIWNTNALMGCHKFINKIWATNCKLMELSNNECKEPHKFLNKFYKEIDGCSSSIEKFEMNVYIARLRMAFNIIYDHLHSINVADLKEAWSKFLVALWPVAPNIAAECYESLCKDTIDKAIWPNKVYEQKEETTVVLQINGIFKKSYRTFDESESSNETYAKAVLNLVSFEKLMYIKRPGKHVLNFIL